METESTPVVPANQLLEVAGVLSEGAARLHRQLSSLPPDERRALLEVVVGQVGDIVEAWSQLVRAVVSTESAAPAGQAAPTAQKAPTESTAPTAPTEQMAPAEPTPLLKDELGSSRVPSFVGGQVGPPPSSPPEPPEVRGETPSSVSSPSASPSSAPPSSVPSPVGASQRSTTVAPFARPTGNGGESPITHLPPRPVTDAPTETALTRDELTGVLNRNAGFTALNREVERCQRYGERLILGYLNVDGLQHVNDTQGPRAGDDLLRKVAAALRATLRSYDVILRLAGDEFLFSMPGADASTAAQRVQDFTVILAQDAPGASVSVGFAELRDGDTVDDLVVRADDDLVEARRRRARPRLR